MTFRAFFSARLGTRGAIIAAGSLIAERAGAVVTDRLGKALRFNSAGAMAEGVLALPPTLHAEAVARLTPA